MLSDFIMSSILLSKADIGLKKFSLIMLSTRGDPELRRLLL